MEGEEQVVMMVRLMVYVGEALLSQYQWWIVVDGCRGNQILYRRRPSSGRSWLREGENLSRVNERERERE